MIGVVLGQFKRLQQLAVSNSERALRFVYGLFFLVAGLGHAINFEMTKDGASIIAAAWDLQGFISPLAAAAVFCLIGGGLSLMIGFYVRLGSVLLLCFLVPATYLHSFVMEIALNTASTLQLSSTDKATQALDTLQGIAVQGHQANVMKNLILICVALYFLVRGSINATHSATASKN